MAILVVRWSVAVVCVLALMLHVVGIRIEAVQLDEFEHLHASWLISQGQKPYVDFFEHHTPLFYYLGAPFLALVKNPGFDMVLNMRFLALGFSVAMAAASWFWLRRHGPAHGLLAVGLLASSSNLLSLGHTTFLDTYSAPLLVMSAALIAGGKGKPRWMLASGVCFGLAVLINLKVSMAVFAPIVIALSRGWEAAGSGRDERRAWALDQAAYLAGGLISIVFVVALLGADGTAGMWRYVVEMNMGWKARQSGLSTLLGTLGRELFVSFCALAFIAWRVWTLPRRRFLLEDRDTPWLFLVSLIAGVFILPVVWAEYFALVVPFLALTAAMAAGDWISAWAGRDEAGVLHFAQSRFGRYSFRALVLFGLVALFPYRAVFRNDAAALVQSAIVLGLFVILYGLLEIACHPRMRMAFALCLALTGVVPLVRLTTTIHRLNNREQRADVEFLLANTRPSDTVFDGYTGYGVFRQHAYFYWMIHQEVQAMLTEADKSDRLIAALAAKRPAIAIADPWVANLPPPVQAYLAANYEWTAVPVLKKRRP